jgi:hypothetical protein
MQFNNPPRKIKNMTTPHLKKSIDRSPLRLGFFLAALAVACLALMPFAQSAQAVGPEPDEGDLIGNVTEEDNAVPELGSDTAEAAVGQAANNPNQQVIQIKPTFCQCVGTSGGERVNLRGEFQISFKPGEFPNLKMRGVLPVLPVKLSKGFKGTCPNTEECLVGTGAKTGRQYMAKKGLKFLIISDQDENKPKLENFANGGGKGRFLFGVVITARPNAVNTAQGDANPGRAVKWTLIYKIRYEWGSDKKVKPSSFKVEPRDVCGHP